MRKTTGLLLSVLLLGLVAPVPSSAARDDLVPITQRAIAAVALQHLPTDTTKRSAMYTHQRRPDGLLGADLRYDGDGEYDGDLVRVSVGPRRAVTCDELSHCAPLASPPGTTTTLVWQTEDPEEDPGVYYVVHDHDDEQVVALSAGPTIRRDPRRHDLEISVDMLVAVASDPRLRLRTTQDVVDAGAALDRWEGGEPDPEALSIVPADDRALAAAFLLSRGGYIAFGSMGPSPLRSRFGQGTLGARLVLRERYGDRGTYDVLAIPDAPRWLRQPCRTRFTGHCVAERKPRGTVRFAWRPSRPGRPGETWAIHVRRAETVAVRTSGYRVPVDRAEAMYAADWYLMRTQVTRRTLGLTTTKETAEDRTATRRWGR